MLIGTSSLFSQLNVTFKGQLTYDTGLNDVWGYVAPDDTEYALVGLINGVSIVSLADPENPTQVGFIDGPNSTWRDIKTWGDYAYVTNETSNGVAVIDLSGLPDNVSSFDWTPTLPNLGTISSCHNIYIDELGFAYLAGCDVNNGGLIYVDVHTNPGQPEFVGAGPNVYSHDVYARDNMAYSSEIYGGEFTIYNVSDKSNTQYVGAQNTGGLFTHNTWLSDDGNIIFTTDEVANAPVGAYDISDPNNITELDQFRPFETLGDGVTPHNVHVWSDWLIISYYTDGCILVDASRPENLVEVGNFDTYIPANTGFSGAWGAYPFLPSGLILISDIGDGLFVLEPNYVSACWLEGQVTDASNGDNIPGAKIKILNTNVNENSGGTGAYATGYAVSGNYDVSFKKAGYEELITSANLENGEVRILNAQLTPLVPFAISGTVVDAITGTPVPNAEVNIRNEDFDFLVVADENGNLNLAAAYADTYEIYAGKWGYKTTLLSGQTIDENNNTLTIEIESGIEDVFALDLGWSVSGNADNGMWERDVPLGLFVDQANIFITPPADATDLGQQCYVTGNGLDIFEDGLAGGNTVLTSPSFDISTYNEARISYEGWFFSVNPVTIDGGDDEMTVILRNGEEEAVIDTFSMAELDEPVWVSKEFVVADWLTPTATMEILFVTSNVNNDITEAGLDNFQAWDAVPVSTQSPIVASPLTVSPNPSNHQFQINYDLDRFAQGSQLLIYNVLGEVVFTKNLSASNGTINCGADLDSGIYFAKIQNKQFESEAVKLVKQ